MITIDENKAFYGKRSLKMGGKLYLMDHPWVMGILNVGPDSFYDGGQYQQVAQAVDRTAQMLNEGAHLIDIGAVSTKPGSALIDPAEEWSRLKEIVPELIRQFPEAHFSIDTYNSETAEKAFNAGVHLINDVSGGTIDKHMAPVVGALCAPYVMMHIQGQPENMQNNPQYENPTGEVAKFFSRQIDFFNRYGAVNLILDPGFGFGKSLEHNYEILQRLSIFKTVFNLPVLVGFSRKSMINKVLGSKADEALNGTTVLNTIGLLKGVDILRVHDVKPALEACKLYLQASA